MTSHQLMLWQVITSFLSMHISLCHDKSWLPFCQCAAVCCSVLQCVAVCCSVLQRVAVCCSVLQCAAACCSVLQDKSWLPLSECICRCGSCYGVATISRLLKITGLFCKRALWKRLYSAKETYHVKEPTNRSHPISNIVFLYCILA